MVNEALDFGALIAPLPIEVISDYRYCFVCPEDHLQRQTVKLFHAWLLEQVE